MLNLFYFWIQFEQVFLDKHFWVSDNQILYDGCPMDKWISKFFSYSVFSIYISVFVRVQVYCFSLAACLFLALIVSVRETRKFPS